MRKILLKIVTGIAAAAAVCGIFFNVPANVGEDETVQVFAELHTPEPTEPPKDYDKLAAELEERLRERAGDWSLYFMNYDTGHEISINSHRVYSASLIKLFVIETVYSQVAGGAMSDTAEVEDLLRRIITYSDNDAWSRIAKKLGGGSYTNGMRLVTETAAAAGYTDTGHFFEGEHKNYNFTSVNDCGAYLKNMLDGSLVSPEYSAKILEYMLQQQLVQKIPAGVPEGITVANKTGELEYMQGDAAVVYSPEALYILVIIGDSLPDSYNTIPFFGELSETVYNFINGEESYLPPAGEADIVEG